jgi:hypothetical protein
MAAVRKGRKKVGVRCWLDAYGLTNPEMRRYLLTYERVGSLTKACRLLGISHNKPWYWANGYDRKGFEVKEHKEFLAALEHANERRIEMLEREAMRRAMSGSDTLLIFLLKAARPMVYREAFRMEHTGNNGGPIQSTTHGVQVNVNADPRTLVPTDPRVLDELLTLAKKHNLTEKLVPVVGEQIPDQEAKRELRKISVDIEKGKVR